MTLPEGTRSGALHRPGADRRSRPPHAAEESGGPEVRPVLPSGFPKTCRSNGVRSAPVGFAEQDFPFGDYGAVAGGRRLARAPRPDYGVRRVRVGPDGAAGTPLRRAEYSPE